MQMYYSKLIKFTAVLKSLPGFGCIPEISLGSVTYPLAAAVSSRAVVWLGAEVVEAIFNIPIEID